MPVSKTDYVARLMELRDAGKQLVHLFSDAVERSASPDDWNKSRKNLLEAELHVMRLDEVIKKLSPAPAGVPFQPENKRQEYHPSDKTQKIELFLAV